MRSRPWHDSGESGGCQRRRLDAGLCSQPPEPGAEYLESSAGARIFLHRVGTPQTDDEIVYSPPAESGWYPYAEVSDDGRFLIVALYQDSAFGNELHVLDLQDPQPAWIPLVGDFESVSQLVTSEGKPDRTSHSLSPQDERSRGAAQGLWPRRRLVPPVRLYSAAHPASGPSDPRVACMLPAWGHAR